jgi:rhodanese-related sulfurtransferase
MNKIIAIFTIFLVLGFGIDITWAEGVFVYEKPKVSHPGKELAPLDAYALIKEDPDHMIIIDVRTKAIPLQFMGEVFKEKEYEMIKNNEFGSDILKKFNPKTDTLFFLCRSGTRAAMALSEAVTAGWPAERAYVILGGRVGGGWKNEGLPWTYTMNPKLVY